MALMLRNEFPKFDFPRLIRTCIVHDPGETITGDVPAIDQDAATPKTVKERLGLLYIFCRCRTHSTRNWSSCGRL